MWTSSNTGSAYCDLTLLLFTPSIHVPVSSQAVPLEVVGGEAAAAGVAAVAGQPMKQVQVVVIRRDPNAPKIQYEVIVSTTAIGSDVVRALLTSLRNIEW